MAFSPPYADGFFQEEAPCSRGVRPRRGVMKVFITGGTGFVGTTLTQKLAQERSRGHPADSQLKSHLTAFQGVSYVEGDPTRKVRGRRKVADQDVVINLAGASIFRRWSDSAKKLIWDSRIQTTQNLVESSLGEEGQETYLFQHLRRRLLWIP